MKQGFGVDAVILKFGKEMHTLSCPRSESIKKITNITYGFCLKILQNNLYERIRKKTQLDMRLKIKNENKINVSLSKNPKRQKDIHVVYFTFLIILI